MTNINPFLFLAVTFLLAGCTSPKEIVSKRYQDDENHRTFKTVFQSDHAALVLAIGEDENCTYTDKHVLINVPPENEWIVQDGEYVQDCTKKETEQRRLEYVQWKHDQEQNRRLWHPGAER